MPADIPATSEIVLKTDSSKEFLDALLGEGWSNWGQGLGGDAAAELMLQIFGAFNMVALAIISALFLWVSAVACAGTAHEGVAFGKRYSSFWMPVRFVGAMGGLVPVFKGLSIFQVAILACIGWSINLGNYVWELGTGYFVEHAGQITVQAPDQTVPQYNQLTNGILKSLTLQYYMAARRGLAVVPGGEWKQETNWFGKNKWVYRFNNNMGSITVDCRDVHPDICMAKCNAVSPAITSLSYIAQQLADPDSPPPAPDALSKASNAIHVEILKGMQNFSATTGTHLQKKLSAFQSMADQYGWFMAGSSYWSISWINQEVRDVMYSGISYIGKEFDNDELETWMYKQIDFEAIMKRVENYISTGYTNRKSANNDILRSSGVIGEHESKLRDIINEYFPGIILPMTIDSLSKNDPIMAVSNTGDYLINTAWGFAGILAVLKVGNDWAKNNWVVKKIKNVLPIPDIDIFVSFLLFSFFLPLLIYGITLAYYLPAIPFLRWIAALAGWVILIVESLIAAPLWLAAHALPEGEGAAGQHGRRGYMLMLAIIIRPPLMVAGFFCAVILMNIMGRLVGGGFEMFFNGVAQTKTLGITGTCSMLVILGTTVIMLANKFFGLIHYIPEHVTNWIGQQMHSLGEKEDQAGAKGVFMGSTDAVSSSTRGLKGLGQDLKNRKQERVAALATEDASKGVNTVTPASAMERSLAVSASSPSGRTGNGNDSPGGQASGQSTGDPNNPVGGGGRAGAGTAGGPPSRELSERDLAAGKSQAAKDSHRDVASGRSGGNQESGIQQTEKPPVPQGKGVQQTAKPDKQQAGERPTAPVTDKSLR